LDCFNSRQYLVDVFFSTAAKDLSKTQHGMK
jgi:hypothetical protein